VGVATLGRRFKSTNQRVVSAQWGNVLGPHKQSLPMGIGKVSLQEDQPMWELLELKLREQQVVLQTV
jgi:hypothetical protein